MMAWAEPLIPHIKAIHVSAIAVWCAGILALPFILAHHEPAIGQSDYGRIRHYTHWSYSYGITPAAVLAVASGTLLVFLRDTFVPWMFLKLAFVSVMLVSHAWIGHAIIAQAEDPGSHRAPHPALTAGLALLPILAVLVLVLAKPDLLQLQLPDWLNEPRGRDLPFTVPSR